MPSKDASILNYCKYKTSRNNFKLNRDDEANN